jgi:hypothetical protein
LSIPIGAIVEISIKGFTLGDKVEKGNNFIFNLPFYGPNLTSRPKKRKPIDLGGQFATLATNVAAIKKSCFDEICIVRSNKP